MGTSKSNSGPKDILSLLPTWALPTPEGEQTEVEEVIETPDGVVTSPEQMADDVSDEDEGDEPDIVSGVEVTSWRSARTLLSNAIKQSGARKDALKRAAQSYVRAHGGSKGAATSANSGRAATARFGGFLADLAQRGLNAALTSLNLASVIGKDAQTVFAAIANALCPQGALPEQAVAREAINDVLEDLYERFVDANGNMTRLDEINNEDLALALNLSLENYIFRRWLQELGKQIEKKSMSPSQAVSLEREAKLFIKDSVRLDLRSVNLITMDWNKEGNALIDNLFKEAYSLLGA